MGNESVIKYSSQSFGVSATKGVLFMLTLKSCLSLLIKTHFKHVNFKQHFNKCDVQIFFKFLISGTNISTFFEAGDNQKFYYLVLTSSYINAEIPLTGIQSSIFFATEV